MSKDHSRTTPDNSAIPILSTDERRTVAPDLLLESGLVWEKYKLPVVAGITLLVLGIVGSELYQSNQAKTTAAASALLDTAKSETDYQKVIDTYPGSLAAANAYLLLGRARANAKNYPGAVQAWREFADKFPQHSLVPSALLGEASALEAQGKMDEARAMYQRVATAYANSYAASLARLGEADLLLAQRKTGDARHIYEDLMAASQKSYASQIAEQNLKMINSVPPLPGTAPMVDTPSPTPATQPVASPSPVAAPSASPAPTP